MLKLVKTLCALNGVSSWEDPVRDYLAAQAAPYADEMRVDAMGNLIVFKRGKKAAGHKLLLAAHMDEVGLMVHRILDDGQIRFQCVGGIDRRVLLGKRVFVGPQGHRGVIGAKPVHLTDRDERSRVPKLDELTIDIGARDAAAARALAAPGDVIAFDGRCVEFGDGFLKAKALDDRVGCAVLLKLLQRDLPMDCTFAFTVQEEVGTRGAFGAAFSVRPEVALVLEGTTASDLPGVQAHEKICIPGAGPVLPFMDGGTIYDKELFRVLCRTAEEHDIPWQTKRYISGGTDARTIQRSRAGVRVAGISCAVRNIHSPASVAAVADFEPMLALAEAFLHTLAEKEHI